MRKQNRVISIISIVFCALFLSACSSQPPSQPVEPPKIISGDVMLRDSQGIAQLGSRWQEGKQKVDKGQALQRQGQAEIDQGQTLIDEGQKIMRESEEGYKNIKQ